MRLVRPALGVVTVAAVIASGLAVAAPPAAADGPAAPPQADAAATSRSDARSAQVEARKSGQRVEVLDQRSDTTTVWANPEGSFTKEIATAPIRVKDGSGTWQDVDATLVHVGSTVRPRAVPYQVTFSAGGTGELASASDGKHRYALSWPGTLPAPVLSGTTATYPDVQPGVDLVLNATRGGFEQSLVLRSRPTNPLVYKLPMSLNGLTVERGPAGEMRLKDSAGDLVMRGPAPVMYDAKRDQSGQPTSARGLAVAAESSPRELVIAPDADWLADPATEYPVVLDPSVTFTRASDTYVESGVSANTNFNGSTDLKIGLRGTASGNLALRSFVTFNTNSLAGKHILSATFKLWNYQSFNCTPSATYVENVTAAWNPAAVTWNNQPSVATPSLASTSSIYGFSGCAANWMQYGDTDTRDLVQDWVDGTTPNYGVRFHTSETDTTVQRKWHSGDVGGSTPPTLAVTYNSYPPSPMGRYVTPSIMADPNNTRYASSTTPILAGVSCDADGDATRVDFEVWDSTKTTRITYSSLSATSVAACTVKEWQVTPALTNGTTYYWRTRAHDGTDYSKTWASWVPLVIDTTAPPTPSVSSTTFTNGSWYTASNPSPLSSAFTFSASPTTDVTGYNYSLDDPDAMTYTTGTSATLSVNEGWHTMYVQTVDKAGNRSTATQFSFGYGHLGVTSPKDGARTAQQLTLSAVANTNVSQVLWEVVAPDGTRTALTGLSDANGAVSNPLSVSGGVVPTVTWNLEAQSPALSDGPIQLSATVTASGSPVQTRKVPVSFDRSDFGLANATTSAGPGSVNLVTGNFQLSSTDAALSAPTSDLSVGRTFNSRADDATPTGPFGPGWVMSTPVESADSEYAELVVNGTTASLILNEGDAIGFTRPTTGTTTFTPEFGFEGYTLTDASSRYDLADLDGNVTKFTSVGSRWLPTSVVQSGETGATSFEYETSPVTRVTRIIAPQPSGLSGTCTTNPETVTGCRSLKLTYFGSGVTPPSGGQVGDYPNRLQKVEAIAYNPATSAMSTVAVASYSYDSNGRLAQAWDPRLSTLKTTYTYNGDGTIATLTPPAEEAWTFAYAPLDGNDGTGRLKSVSRPTLLVSPTTATTTYVYRVPVTGGGAPYDLSSTELARSGQQDLPTTATAVFPATTTATFGGGSLPVPTSYDRAGVHYLNVDGREVNTADPNGGIDTTEHDSRGSTVRTLSAGNRKRALDQGTSTAQEAAIAQSLSSLTVYAADGMDVLETFGPERWIDTETGTVRARAHTTNTYDEGMTGGPYHLVTTSVTSARAAGESSDRSSESRTTKTEYGTTTAEWTRGTPTAVIADAVTGGLNLTTRTTYETDGRVLTQTLPKGGTATNTAATRVTRYYRAGTGSGDTACDSKPAWVNLICSVSPGGQPAGVALPTTYNTSYDMFNRPLVVEEKASGVLLRTTTSTYDSAGRLWKTAVTGTTGTGTSLPTIETAFDSNGWATETRSLVGGSTTALVQRTFNTLGQITSYVDADGNTSSATYDVLGRVATTNDGKGTQTWTYDGGTERRGLATSLVDSQAGTWSATYDVEGTPTVTLPNDLVARTTVDETGSATGLSYVTSPTCADASCTELAETVTESVHGQWLTHMSTLSDQSYTYDDIGRLTKVADSVGGQCTTRWYTFDAGTTGNSNRSKLETFAPDADGACQTTTATTVNWTYDTADRIDTAGTVYDSLGRTTTVLDGDALGSGALTVGYHVNDLVQSIAIGGGTPQTYTLDVDQQRVRSWSDGTTTRTNHYDGDSDNPSWTTEGGTAWTRNIGGLAGDLGAIYSSTAGTATLQLTNLHGDVVATAPTTSTTLASTSEATEYGTPRGSTGTRYGWVGGKQRAADTPGGLSVMGVRLYNPTTGRFLQVDPVYGGNANAYTYPNDPITKFDLDGRVRTDSSAGSGGPGYRMFTVRCGWISCTIYFTRWGTRRVQNMMNEISGIGWAALGIRACAGAGPGAVPCAAAFAAYGYWMNNRVTSAVKNNRCVTVKFFLIANPVPIIGTSNGRHCKNG